MYFICTHREVARKSVLSLYFFFLLNTDLKTWEILDACNNMSPNKHLLNAFDREKKINISTLGD